MNSARDMRCEVLIVEDEPIIRMNTVEAFLDAGFAVWQAANADEALEVLREHHDISVIFSDVNLPGSLDGIALAREASRRMPDAKIILTSGRGVPQHLLPAGGWFFPKPYRMEQIVRTVEHLIEHDLQP